MTLTLGLGLGVDVQNLQVLLYDGFSHGFAVWFSSTVIYKFSAEDNEPISVNNASHAEQWNSVTSV